MAEMYLPTLYNKLFIMPTQYEIIDIFEFYFTSLLYLYNYFNYLIYCEILGIKTSTRGSEGAANQKQRGCCKGTL